MLAIIMYAIFGFLYAYIVILYAEIGCYGCARNRLEQDRGALLKRQQIRDVDAGRTSGRFDCGAVLSGEFPPGFRLDEAALAERFGVSRTPVREAIRLLASTGLIEVKPRRGASVATATSAQLETLFGAMAEIEATCARLAAVSMTPIERRRLQSRHEAMAELVARDDREAYAAANVEFHTQIYFGAHNEILGAIRQGTAAAPRALPPRPVPNRGPNVAVARRARRRRQGDPRLRRRGRPRGDVPSHEPGRRFVRPSRRGRAGPGLNDRRLKPVASGYGLKRRRRPSSRSGETRRAAAKRRAPKRRLTTGSRPAGRNAAKWRAAQAGRGGAPLPTPR